VASSIPRSLGEGRSAQQVTAANNNRDFGAHLGDVGDLLGDAVERLAMDAERARRAETFSADFQNDALVF
jgi:hypothetical protein